MTTVNMLSQEIMTIPELNLYLSVDLRFDKCIGGNIQGEDHVEFCSETKPAWPIWIFRIMHDSVRICKHIHA